MQTGGELTGASTAALPESDAESLVDVDHAAAKIWPEWPALSDSAQDVLKAAADAVRETGETAQQVLRTVENAMLAEKARIEKELGEEAAEMEPRWSRDRADDAKF